MDLSEGSVYRSHISSSTAPVPKTSGFQMSQWMLSTNKIIIIIIIIIITFSYIYINAISCALLHKVHKMKAE